MLSIRHITTAGALAVVLATPATGFAQVLRGHDLHAAQPAQTGHVLRGHDLHAADTTGATAVNRAVEESAATPASGFDWEDAGIGALGMLGLVVAAAGLALLGRDRPQSFALPEEPSGR